MLEDKITPTVLNEAITAEFRKNAKNGALGFVRTVLKFSQVNSCGQAQALDFAISAGVFSDITTMM